MKTKSAGRLAFTSWACKSDFFRRKTMNEEMLLHDADMALSDVKNIEKCLLEMKRVIIDKMRNETLQDIGTAESYLADMKSQAHDCEPDGGKDACLACGEIAELEESIAQMKNKLTNL